MAGITASEMLAACEHRELEVAEKLLQLREARARFATKHHRNTKGEPMDFAHSPHIQALYNSLAPEIALQGSVQSLKSEWAIVDHFAASYIGLSVFFVVPKFEARTTYVQNRVNRCVERVPEYKRIIGEGFFDSVALKNFGPGVVKYVGSNVLSDFKEFPADILYVEEVDECDAENVNYALDRLRASKYQFKRYIGNPKLQNRGINRLFNMSDGREWWVPCGKCGERVELDWFAAVVKEITDHEGNVVDYRLLDGGWEPGCRRDVRAMCPACDGGELLRASPEGVWLPKRPEIERFEGYHISMLCSMFNAVAGMWERFARAINDPAALQQFFNSDLGLPFTAVGNRVTESLMDQCIEPGYEFTIRGDDEAHVKGGYHDGPCSMGVDVGANFDVRISFAEGRKRKAVYLGKVKHLDDLLDLCERYNVEKAVMDSMPEITVAQDFQEQAPCDVWLCRYRGEGTDRRRVYDTTDRIINVDRTEALDRSFAQLRRRKNVLPENYPMALGGAYVLEMTNPVRQIVEDTRGNSRYEWSKGLDHHRHADTYDMLAADLLEESVLDAIEVA